MLFAFSTVMKQVKVSHTMRTSRPCSWMTNRQSYTKTCNHIFRPGEQKYHNQDNNWLQHLTPLPPRDDSDRERALEERKKNRVKKHYQICHEELEGIINYAFYQIDHKDNARLLKNSHRNFQDGIFLPVPKSDDEDDEPEIQETAPVTVRGCDTHPEVKLLLTPNSMSPTESFMALSRNITTFQYDPNPVVDNLLSLLQTQMAPYCSPISENKNKISFPYFINMLGPPCSGKSTILQFIQRNFDVSVLTIELFNCKDNLDPNILYSTDEKLIISTIIDRINQCTEQTGLILVNFPQTKQQFISLDKAIQMNSKSRKSSGSQFYLGVNGYIFTNFTPEQCQQQASDRLINENTGSIFHKTFRPIYPCTTTAQEADDEICSVPGPKQLEEKAEDYISQFSQFEPLVKKFPFIEIPCLNHFWELENQIVHFFEQISQKRYPNLVRFADENDFDRAVMNSKIYNLWMNECIPIFGEALGSEYERIVGMEERMEELSQLAKERFYLETSRNDSRSTFLRQQHNNRHLKQEIWQKSNEVRDEHLGLVDQIISESPINAFPVVLQDNAAYIFEHSIKRWLVIDWFITNYGPYIEGKSAVIKGVKSPEIPEFDMHDLPNLIVTMRVLIERARNIVCHSVVRGIIAAQSMLLPGLRPIVDIQEKKSLGPEKFSIRYPFDSHLEFGVKARKKKSRSTVENIKLFWNYVHTETSRRFMKCEADFLGKLFDFFETEKARATKLTESYEEILKNELYSWVFEKNSNEMSEFSQKRKISPEDFPMDTSCLKGRCRELFDGLDGKLPSWSDIPRFNKQKLEDLVKAVNEKNSEFIELDCLIQLAHDVGMDEKECMQLEVLARLDELPLYINTRSFFDVIIDSQ